MLHRLCFSFRCRFCSEMQGFTAVSRTLPNRRPKAATYLCRFAAKARFDNRYPQGGVSKGEGSQPLPFGRFKGKRFLRKGGNRNPPFLKWRSLVTFFRQGKKVTRRRQKEKMSRAGQSPAPTLHLPKASTFLTATAPQIPRRGAASPPAPPAAARSSPPRPRCRTPRTWPPAPPAAAAPPGPPRFSAQARCVPRR